jgi:hypothetical protein
MAFRQPLVQSSIEPIRYATALPEGGAAESSPYTARREASSMIVTLKTRQLIIVAQSGGRNQ